MHRPAAASTLGVFIRLAPNANQSLVFTSLTAGVWFIYSALAMQINSRYTSLCISQPRLARHSMFELKTNEEIKNSIRMRRRCSFARRTESSSPRGAGKRFSVVENGREKKKKIGKNKLTTVDPQFCAMVPIHIFAIRRPPPGQCTRRTSGALLFHEF